VTDKPKEPGRINIEAPISAEVADVVSDVANTIINAATDRLAQTGGGLACAAIPNQVDVIHVVGVRALALSLTAYAMNAFGGRVSCGDVAQVLESVWLHLEKAAAVEDAAKAPRSLQN
jgi:hypothetical protein